MALTDDSMVMPVSPMYGGGYGNNGGLFGNGGDSWLGILFLIALCNGGWGGFGGGFGGGYGNMMLGYDFPWLLNGQNGINSNVNSGFRDAQLHDSVTSVRDGVSNLATQLCGCCGDVQMSLANGFSGVQNALCNGFAGTTAAVNGAQNAIAQQLYSNQIADLERSFAAQTASTQGMNAIQSQLAQCCCDNRAATADLKYTIATEACSTRTTDTQNMQLILNAINDGFRAMSDQRYQDKIDAKNDEIAQLRQENLYARGQASQIAQNEQIVNSIYNRLDTCPVGTTPVYGRTPIFTCNNGNTCGCGCGA